MNNSMLYVATVFATLPVVLSGQSSGTGRDAFYNVKSDFGAKGDCSTDDTTAFQNFFNQTQYNSSTLIVPTPSGGCYKLTATLVIPLSAGWVVEGAGAGLGGGGTGRPSTVLTMFTANTPMFEFETELTQQFTFEHLALNYNSAQPSSNTLAIFFYMN